nr:ATP-binding protein [Thalassotalea sp. G2M2-11]
MDAIPDYLIFNDTKGHLIGCNLAFEQFVGRAEQDILGTKVGTLIDNKLGRALLLCAEDFQAQKSRCGTFEVIETSNNTYELFSSDFYNQAHQVLGSIVIIRDVTKQYAINSALENAKEQAELANKAKSQFLANMSHEIRTPINAIYGMQSLLRQTALTNQQLQQLTHAQDASVALLHLVDELLDLAKIESGNMSINKQNCVLDNAVNQAIKLNINNIDSEQVAFHVRIGSNVPSHVITDEMRLVQVLSNLLNNAIKFTHDGEISITIECLDKQTEQALVKFTVADTGIGIEKSKQQDLFKAFVQADESMTREYGGSGLGLSICQRIVNLLGGEIVLTSEFGVGSTFSFVLPFDYDAQAIQFEREQSINFFALQFEPPVEFTQLLTSYGYHYDALQCLSEVEQAPEAVINVLLVQVEQVNDSLCQSLSEQLACTHSNLTKDQQCLVMVYQTCQSMDINHHYDLLNQYQIPYVICEAPLYRYSLCNALAELDEQALSAEQNGQTNAENVEKLPTEHKSLQGVSILLVEDNLVNQLVAKELLQSMQAKVTIVDNGQKAIDMLAQKEFDVVLMDIQMPVMDGLEATRLIRSESKYQDLPIIAMTAHARQEDKESSYAAGMNLHIAKPVTAELLLSSIQHVLSEVSMEG